MNTVKKKSAYQKYIGIMSSRASTIVTVYGLEKIV